MTDLTAMTPEERDHLAAEYALGVLAPDEARALDPLMERDADFISRVWAWRDRLTPLAHRIAWVEPAPEVWEGIRAVVAASIEEKAAQAAPPEDGAEVVRLRRRLRAWRGAAAVATLAALAAVLALFVLPPSPPIAPPAQPTRFVAMLAPPGSEGHGWVAAVDVETRQIALVPLDGTAAPAGQVQELWFIRDASTPPRSLGVISASERIPAPAEALTTGGTLAVSLEPPGGSPTGAPTGPVIFVGELKPAE